MGLRTALFYVCSFSRVIRPDASDLNLKVLRDRLLQEITNTIQRLLPNAQTTQT